MSNPVIQQTLVDLEQSLSKIESARTQVNNVSEKSEQIISQFNRILKSIESISDGVGIDKESIKQNSLVPALSVHWAKASYDVVAST